MTRILLTYVLPLLLPTALYLLWLRFAGGGARREVPWMWLAIAGLGLAAMVLSGLALSGGDKDGIYEPPHVENGKIVPGHVRPGS